MKRVMVAWTVFVVPFLWASCASETTSGGDTGGGPDALTGYDGVGTDLPTTGEASLTAKVKLIKDFPLQVVDLLKQYLTSPDYIFRGDLYLQLCADPDCKTVALTKKVLDEELYSTGFPKDVTVEGLPAGTWYVRFALDTKYSKQYQGGFDETGGLGPMDVVQVAEGAPAPQSGKNPPAGAKEVTLIDRQTADVGGVLLGSLLFEDPAFPPSTEEGLLLTASSGTDVFRNEIKVVDLSTFTTLEPIVLQYQGKPFEGDICGFVQGQGSALWVIAVGAPGAYVFHFDKERLAFGNAEPVLIPHPDYKGGSTEGLDPERYPWPCRGVSVVTEGKETLYLIAFKGAGALTSSAPYPLVVVDVTGMANGQQGSLVVALDKDKDPFFDSARLLRGIATDGQSVFVLEPSWSKLVDKNTVYKFDVSAGVQTTNQVTSGTAEDTCDSSNNWVPAIAVVTMKGKKVVAVGNDDDISFYDTDLNPLGKLDTTSYGRLVTSFAVSPDGGRLYAMPNCKSASKKASVQLGVGNERLDLDRHAIVVIDLSSDPTSPTVLETDRDFDEDGQPDGGIDLEFLYLKRSLLRWCEACSGVVPPTAYTGPEIAVGQKNIFLRGTGIQSDEKNSSGLGQLADLGVYDLARGQGVMFRGYQVWLDGPSSRWGFDLNPSNPAKDYTDDVSTAALLWLPKAP